MAAIYKQFATQQICLALQELGFNEPCLAYYHSDGGLSNFKPIRNASLQKELKVCAAPLWQQAIDWLESKGYVIDDIWNADLNQKWQYQVHTLDRFSLLDEEKYFESRIACWKEAIEKIIAIELYTNNIDPQRN